MYRGISDTSQRLWKQNWGKKHIDVVLTLASSYFKMMVRVNNSSSENLLNALYLSLNSQPPAFIQFLSQQFFLQIKCFFVTDNFLPRERAVSLSFQSAAHLWLQTIKMATTKMLRLRLHKWTESEPISRLLGRAGAFNSGIVNHLYCL